MKKTLKWLTLVAIVAIAGWSYQTYPAIGGVLYHNTVAAEATLYGLHKSTVTLDDSTISLFDGGPLDGEAVILIHGYSAEKDVWVRFARFFTDQYRVIIPDLPGHGETGFNPDISYDTKTQASRVVAIMDALGIDKAHVMGNSMGGFITARMAHDHPTRLLSATLFDPAGVQSPEPSDMALMLEKGDNPFQVNSREDFRAFYGMTMAKAPWVPSVTLDYFAERYMARRAELAQIFEDIHNKNMLDAHLQHITVPTLVVWGAKDQLIDVTAADVWVNGIAGARKIIYDDLGHMPMVEDAERSANDALAFIAGN